MSPRVVVAGILQGVVDEFDREIPRRAHIGHHLDLLPVAGKAPVDNGALGAELLDHDGLIVRRPEEDEDRQGRNFVQHLADQFGFAVVDKPVDVAGDDLAHPRFDLVHPLRREGVAENLAVRPVRLDLLVDQGRLDPDVEPVAHLGRRRAQRAHRMPGHGRRECLRIAEYADAIGVFHHDPALHFRAVEDRLSLPHLGKELVGIGDIVVRERHKGPARGRYRAAGADRTGAIVRIGLEHSERRLVFHPAFPRLRPGRRRFRPAADPGFAASVRTPPTPPTPCRARV